MVFRKINISIYILFLVVVFSCTSKDNFGNGIYYQSMYESIDVGNRFGSCIFYGTKKDGYTSYNKILIYSDILSLVKEGKYLYVKQSFNDSIFKNLLLNNFSQAQKFNIIPSYTPVEIQDLYLKHANSLTVNEIIEISNFYKKRKANKGINYYILEIEKR